MHRLRTFSIAAASVAVTAFVVMRVAAGDPDRGGDVAAREVAGVATVHSAVTHDVGPRLAAPVVGDAAHDLSGSGAPRSASDVPEYALAPEVPVESGRVRKTRGVAPIMTTPPGSGEVEQTAHGTLPAATLAASFDGLGEGFTGPQGSAVGRNPSDNTLAVGPDHIMQIVNTRMAIFTKKGKRFNTTGKALYGPVETRNVFRGFGGACESHNNGDAVARYDQLADRWLIVMPIFSRLPLRAN
ncbi:MAG TPA: hypothetical protein VIQ74_00980, partial [Gemmatimonadaceae bacterium]